MSLLIQRILPFTCIDKRGALLFTAFNISDSYYDYTASYSAFMFCHRYEIIGHCWQYLPDDRPTFEEILLNLKEYWDDAHLYA